MEKVGEYTRNGAVEKNLNVKDGEEFPEPPLSNYTAGIFATWELDVWKKLRNSKKGRCTRIFGYDRRQEFYGDQSYCRDCQFVLRLIALDNQLAIIDQNLEIQENALKMVRLQKQAARATELAVRRFEAEVLKNRSHLFEVKQEIVETENKLNYLVGRKPQPIERNSENFIEGEVETVNVGIPSQLLMNRPDIRRAEYELKASKLDVQVARTNFYPSIGIKAGGVGLEAFKPKFVTHTPASLLYSAAGDLVAPLINRNAIKAEYRQANARQIQAVYEYEKSILQGYIEVANQLSNIDNLKKTYDMKSGQVMALTKSIDLSTQLFRSARVEYIEVLLTQREALESKMELVETKRDQFVARVNMYKALGGGWN